MIQKDNVSTGYDAIRYDTMDYTVGGYSDVIVIEKITSSKH